MYASTRRKISGMAKSEFSASTNAVTASDFRFSIDELLELAPPKLNSGFRNVFVRSFHRTHLCIASSSNAGRQLPAFCKRLEAGTRLRPRLCERQHVRALGFAPLRPSFHHCTALFERIATAICGFGLVADGTREHCFAKLG